MPSTAHSTASPAPERLPRLAFGIEPAEPDVVQLPVAHDPELAPGLGAAAPNPDQVDTSTPATSKTCNVRQRHVSTLRWLLRLRQRSTVSRSSPGAIRCKREGLKCGSRGFNRVVNRCATCIGHFYLLYLLPTGSAPAPALPAAAGRCRAAFPKRLESIKGSPHDQAYGHHQTCRDDLRARMPDLNRSGSSGAGSL